MDGGGASMLSVDPVAPLARHPAPGPRRRRVLVAEDDPELRALVTTALDACGCETAAVKDGDELATLLGAGDQFEVVLADVSMPGLPSVQSLAARAARCGGSPRVIFMTGLRDRSLRAAVQALGADLLEKPFNLETL